MYRMAMRAVAGRGQGGVGERKEGVAIRGLQEEPRGDGMLCTRTGQCPHPGCDADLEACKMPPLGNLGKGSTGPLCILPGDGVEIYNYPK